MQKPSTSYLNKNSTSMNLEQKFELEMYQEKTYYNLFEQKSSIMNLEQNFVL